MNWMQVKTSVDWGDCIIDAFTKVGIKVEILGNKCAIVQGNSYIFIQNCIYSKNSGSFDLSFKSKNDRTFKKIKVQKYFCADISQINNTVIEISEALKKQGFFDNDAHKFDEIIKECIGQDYLSNELSEQLQRALKAAYSLGKLECK